MNNASQPLSASLRGYTGALRHRNFRLYIGGQLLNQTGTWVRMIAQGWLVYRLSHSAEMLGLVAFASQIPFLVLSPIAGVLADRMNRRRFLILTQTLAMLQAFILAALTLTGMVQVWHVFYLSLALGIINVFDFGARMPFVVEMVTKEELVNAIAMNSTTVNGGRILGSALAGVVIAVVGEGSCFLITGIGSLAANVTLWMLRLPPREIARKTASAVQNLREGWNYAWNHLPARALFLLLGLSSIMNYSFHQVLMPIFADQIPHGGPKALGMMMGALGAGVILGAIYMASWNDPRGLGRKIVYATLACSFFLICFGFSRNLYLSMGLLLFVGVCLMLSINGINATLQTIVPDSLRGRVVGGFYSLMFQGMVPIGSLLGGWLGGLIGAPWTIAFGGLVCIGGALAFNRQRYRVEEAIAQATSSPTEIFSASAPVLQQDIPPPEPVS